MLIIQLLSLVTKIFNAVKNKFDADKNSKHNLTFALQKDRYIVNTD